MPRLKLLLTAGYSLLASASAFAGPPQLRGTPPPYPGPGYGVIRPIGPVGGFVRPPYPYFGFGLPVYGYASPFPYGGYGSYFVPYGPTLSYGTPPGFGGFNPPPVLDLEGVGRGGSYTSGPKPANPVFVPPPATPRFVPTPTAKPEAPKPVTLPAPTPVPTPSVSLPAPTPVPTPMAVAFAAQAEQFARAGKFDEAARAFRHAMVDEPQNGTLAVRASQVLTAAGKYDEAAGAAQQGYASIDPKDWLAEAKNSANLFGDPQVATAVYEALLKASADAKAGPGVKFLAGIAAAGRGDFARAASDFDAVTKLVPQDELAAQWKTGVTAKK